MKKSRKIVLSLLNIALLAVLIAGATYALFTDEAKVNTTITSATVDIELELKSLELYSLDVLQNGLEFENGGTAEEKADGSIELKYVSPGDKMVAHFRLANSSNITIAYNVMFSISGELASGLVTSVNGAPAAWTELAPGQSVEDLAISVELPVTAGNEYQDKSANVLILVQAIQGNGLKPEVKSVAELQTKLDVASKDPNQPTLVKLTNDLTPSSSIVVKEGTHVQIDLNGNDIVAAADFVADGATQLIMIEKGASLSLVDSSNTTRYGYYDGSTYVISETNPGNADVLPGGNISMGTVFADAANIPASSQWKVCTIRNQGTLSLEGVSLAGTNIAMGDGGAIYSGDSSNSELSAQCSISINNSAICGNTAIGSGVIYTNNPLTITNSLVSNNVSFNGGAVVARSTNAKVYTESTTYSYNTAEVGAVMQLRAGASVEAYYCPIIGNEAKDMTVAGTSSKTPMGVIIDIMGNTPCEVVVQSCPITGNKLDGVEIVDINAGLTQLISLYTNSIRNSANECLHHTILIQGQELGVVLHQYYAAVWSSSCQSTH